MVAQDLTARDPIGRDQKLLVRGLSVVFTRRRGGTVVAVENLSLGVRDKEFVSIVGPSGCGKSTLLRIVAGLIRPGAGEVFVDARPGRIKAEVAVALPRPREVDVMDTPAFITIRQRIHGLIREETLRVLGEERVRPGPPGA